MTNETILSSIEELSYMIARLDEATKELARANSTLVTVSKVEELGNIVKMMAYVMLSDEDTRERIKKIAKKSKDKKLLDFVERFDDA